MIKPAVKTFMDDEDGSLSVEILFAVPILVLAIALTLDVWDAFKTITVNQKSTYMVSDFLSREGSVEDDKILAMYELFDFVAHSSGDNAIRVTAVSSSVDPEDCDMPPVFQWSRGQGGLPDLTADTLTVIEDRIPPMHMGEWLIVVESEQEWAPLFDIGIKSHRFTDISISRPRTDSGLVQHEDVLPVSGPSCAI